jgi:hypothetical protein
MPTTHSKIDRGIKDSAAAALDLAREINRSGGAAKFGDASGIGASEFEDFLPVILIALTVAREEDPVISADERAAIDAAIKSIAQLPETIEACKTNLDPDACLCWLNVIGDHLRSAQRTARGREKRRLAKVLLRQQKAAVLLRRIFRVEGKLR